MKSIELHHLDRNCRAVTGNTFPVHWSDSGRSLAADILDSRTVTGVEASELAELFGRAFLRIPDTTLCGHYPNYGLRYYDGGILTLETTVCLSCTNWIEVSGGVGVRYQISPDTFSALSSTLRSHLPLSPNELAS